MAEQSHVEEQRVQESETSSGEKEFDFVIFGASGFTGQYVVEEVVRTVDGEKGLKWAVAGRSMQKLQQVLQQTSKYTGRNLEEVPILIVDIGSEASVQEMCQKTKVVVNCVGPYRFYGEQVVRACVENKAHHIDISGEPEFLEKMQLLYHNKAKEAGVYILGSCGWDSIPAELGFIFTRNQGEVESIEAYTEIKFGPEGGCLNFGTWQSAVHGLANAKNLSSIRKQLNPEKLPIKKTNQPKRGAVFYNNDVGNYCVPFLGSDKSVIMRTQRYNYDVKGQEPIPFNIFMRLPGFIALIGLTIIGFFMTVFCRFSFGRWLLESFPGVMSLGVFSKNGPTRKQIQQGTFSITMFGTVPEEQKKIVTRVSGPEPGYAATPIVLMQATYAILKEQDKLPDKGGVYTPGVAFAETSLMDRLASNKITFEVVSTP